MINKSVPFGNVPDGTKCPKWGHRLNAYRKEYMMKNNKKTWRRLDNSAKIFPMSTGQKYSTVFRLSVVLKEEIQRRIS